MLKCQSLSFRIILTIFQFAPCTLLYYFYTPLPVDHQLLYICWTTDHFCGILSLIRFGHYKEVSTPYWNSDYIMKIKHTFTFGLELELLQFRNWIGHHGSTNPKMDFAHQGYSIKWIFCSYLQGFLDQIFHQGYFHFLTILDQISLYTISIRHCITNIGIQL